MKEWTLRDEDKAPKTSCRCGRVKMSVVMWEWLRKKAAESSTVRFHLPEGCP